MVYEFDKDSWVEDGAMRPAAGGLSISVKRRSAAIRSSAENL